MTPPVPLIAAHRGGAKLWPENSMTAFAETAALTVDQVEFDVHPTRDGHLVVHHDATVDRMTDGSGAIVGMTADELGRLTINGTNGESIPHLAEVLDLLAPTHLTLRLEIKGDAEDRRYPGLEGEILAMLDRHGMLDRTVATSFLVDTLEAIGGLSPELPRIWLINFGTDSTVPDLADAIRRARSLGLDELALRASELDADKMVQAATSGLRMGAFAAHDETLIRHVFGLGVSVFTTDRPDLALDVRAAYRESKQG